MPYFFTSPEDEEDFLASGESAFTFVERKRAAEREERKSTAAAAEALLEVAQRWLVPVFPRSEGNAAGLQCGSSTEMTPDGSPKTILRLSAAGEKLDWILDVSVLEAFLGRPVVMETLADLLPKGTEVNESAKEITGTLRTHDAVKQLAVTLSDLRWPIAPS